MEVKKKVIEIFHNLGIQFEEGIEELDYYIEDSIMFISFIVEVEQEFAIEISDEYLEIGRLNTVEDVVNMIISEKPENLDIN